MMTSPNFGPEAQKNKKKLLSFHFRCMSPKTMVIPLDGTRIKKNMVPGETPIKGKAIFGR